MPRGTHGSPIHRIDDARSPDAVSLARTVVVEPQGVESPIGEVTTQLGEESVSMSAYRRGPSWERDDRDVPSRLLSRHGDPKQRFVAAIEKERLLNSSI